jgi:two-component system phosphate regulon sensor histidine kinase PhoR
MRKKSLLYFMILVFVGAVITGLFIVQSSGGFNLSIFYNFSLGIFIAILFTLIFAIKFSNNLSLPLEKLALFDDISLTLRETISDLQSKNATLNSILNSMSGGVIVIDNNRRVILLNNVAETILELKHNSSTSDYLGLNIIEIIRNPTVNNMIIKGFAEKTKVSNNITLHYMKDKIISIFVIPVELSDKANLGIMIYMEDVSEIRKLEQIRTEFVSNVTHELKTPLTSIMGFVETLKQGAIEDPEVSKKFLDIIDIEAERLYMLIEDVLELSEIESNHSAADMQFDSCDIDDVISEVIDVVNGPALKKSIMIHTDIEEGLKVKADKHRVKQLFINLVDNAIKYSDDNGEIFINAFTRNNKVIIKVRDTGIGIAEEHLPRIFERFYRVDKSRTRNTGGTGLGLSIVKHIVQLYNGDLSVNSELGKGTEFTITL